MGQAIEEIAPNTLGDLLGIDHDICRIFVAEAQQYLPGARLSTRDRATLFKETTALIVAVHPRTLRQEVAMRLVGAPNFDYIASGATGKWFLIPEISIRDRASANAVVHIHALTQIVPMRALARRLNDHMRPFYEARNS
jgi:hypothetical protein